MADKVFPDGIFIKEPHTNAPDFVLGKIQIKVLDAVRWLEEKKDDRGWVTLDMKKGKNGKYYAELDTWKPDPSKRTDEAETPKAFNNTVGQPDEINADDIPF